MNLEVSQLYIYPVKSLAGIRLNSSLVTDRGLLHDRRWMIVDLENQFLTIREFPMMTRLQPVLSDSGLTLLVLGSGDEIQIPFGSELEEISPVTIWNATVAAHNYSQNINDWLSDKMGTACKLVFMPDRSLRPVDTTSGYKPAGKLTSFADAYPFLVLSEASIQDLNDKCSMPISVARFRPNIVFSGSEPYFEDSLEHFSINGVNFEGLENCARCGIPNVDPETGILDKQKEPLRTLSKYRLRNKNIEFGRNTVHSNTGQIHVGDKIIIK